MTPVIRVSECSIPNAGGTVPRYKETALLSSHSWLFNSGQYYLFPALQAVTNAHGSLVTISSAWVYMRVPWGKRHLSHSTFSKHQDLFTQQIADVLGIPDILFWDFQEEYIPVALIV